jgi:antirestriction protein ArdC/phage/plasmid primase-like uncharacterized protein
MLDIEDFRAFAMDLGVVLPDRPRMDGRVDYAKTVNNRGGKKSASYLIFREGNGGWIINHQDNTGIQYFFEKGARRELSESEKAAIRGARLEAEREKAKGREGAVNTALDAWERSRPIQSYPYLDNPKLDAAGLRVTDNKIVVPILGIDKRGEVHWVGSQHINSYAKDGVPGKLFARGTPSDGSFAIIPVLGSGRDAPLESWAWLKEQKMIVVVEGVGTALAVHQATGLPVVAALYAGNLPKLTETLWERTWGKLLIVPDLDGEKAKYSGIYKGMQAAEVAGERARIGVIFPDRDRIKSGYDARDFYRDYGPEALRERLTQAVSMQEFQERYPNLTRRAREAQEQTTQRITEAGHGAYQRPESAPKPEQPAGEQTMAHDPEGGRSKGNGGKGEVTKERRDLRQEITDNVVKALETGANPWKKGWKGEEKSQAIGLGRARNVITGAGYNGGNRMALTMVALERGYPLNEWATFNQVRDSKTSNIRKGEHGTPIEVWKTVPFYRRKDLDTQLFANDKRIIPDSHDNETLTARDGQKYPLGAIKAIVRPKDQDQPEHLSFRDASYKHDSRFAQSYTVFNVSQMDGELAKRVEQYKPKPLTVEGMQAEAGLIVEAMMKDGLQIGVGGDRAFYRRSTDTVQIPKPEQFHTQADFYGTLLHEVGHSTGHEKRLDRQFGTKFGDEQYAREELRAELFSYFISAETGLPHDVPNHESYLVSWADALKKDKNELFAAARDASQAVDYVLERSQALSLSHETQREFMQVVAEQRAQGAEPAAAQPPKAAVVPSDTRAGEYVGKIVAVTPGHIVQEVKAVDAKNREGERVVHTRKNLEKRAVELKKNQDAHIRYREGRGTVQDAKPIRDAQAKQKSQSQEQSQAHGR